MKQQELSRVCTMGERLTAANHYATEVFKSHGKELKGSWDNLAQMADDRATLFSLSVSFHDKQQKVSLVVICKQICEYWPPQDIALHSESLITI